MLRKTAAMLAIMILALAINLDAQTNYEIRVFSGMRFGGSFVNAGYGNNPILEDLDVAPGLQFGGSFNYQKSSPFTLQNPLMFELLVNFQSSDLRFKPASISGVPDSILAQFEVDGDKLILGDVNVTYIHGGLLYKIGSNSSWSPHVNFGLGVTIFYASEGDLNESKFSFSFGGGVTRMFSETIGSRFQMTGYLTSLPSDVYWVDSGGGAFRSFDNNYFFQGEISGGAGFCFLKIDNRGLTAGIAVRLSKL